MIDNPHAVLIQEWIAVWGIHRKPPVGLSYEEWLEGQVATLRARLEEAERLCPGCGHSLAQCYDDARSGRMRPGPCCPDCNHSAGAFVAPDDSGGAQEETK